MPDFEDYPISTQTLIIKTNLTINCQQFYDTIECIEITKPTSGKSRMCVQEMDTSIGTIAFAQYKNDYKGTPFKKISKKHFLNSVTIIMNVGLKYINIKVSNKGKLQVTGCNKHIHPMTIIHYFWKFMGTVPDTWQFHENETVFRASVIPVMSNINFSIDFQINREKLNSIINTQTKYVSILETSDGYVGVNIKIHMDQEPLKDILVEQYSYINDEWELSKTKVMDYIETLSHKEQKKKISKCYINTFLVFYSGKVIMSGGISFLNRKLAYQTFMEIIDKYKQEIKVNP